MSTISIIDSILRIVPFSTLSIIGVIIAFKYDLWLNLIEENSAYFGVSKRKFVIFSLVSIFLIMGICFGVWRLGEYIIDYRENKRQAQLTYEREREALIMIFNSLDGKNWKDKTRWCSDEPLYLWKGVKLNPYTNRVNKLILPENRLSGV
jgi:hypothetical protein